VWRDALNARAARARRKQEQQRALELAGGAEPTLEEKITSRRVQRELRLRALHEEYIHERNELESAYAQSRAAIRQDFDDEVRALRMVASEARLGIVVAPASTDLGKVAAELDRLTGKADGC
jgi:hypothetical protein